MRRWHQDTTVWLMLLSTLLLLLISAYWIRASYQKERTALQREATLVFRTAVLELEDSLSSNSFAQFARRRPGRTAHLADSSQVLTTVIERDTLRRSMRPRGNRRGSAEQFVGALALVYKRSKTEHADPEIMYDRTPVPELLGMIEQKGSALLLSEDLAFGLQFMDSTQVAGLKSPLLSRSYRDVFSDQKVYGVITDYRSLIFRKIIPEILLSFFMISVTLIAFMLMYRNLRRQSRIAEMRRDLISNITHELQTPISTVKVALEALQSFSASEKSSPKTQEYLEISQHELSRLSHLVDSVLKNAVSEHNSPILPTSEIDLKSIVAAAVQSMSLQFEQSSAQINFQADGEQYLVQGDEIQLSSVIYNLLDNALKYSTAPPQIEIKLRSDEKHIILTITDQGIGIPKAYQGKIFERFFRVPQGDQHNVKGHGLGLSYVRQVIERHRGKITVHSKRDSGTQFLIKLPMHYEGA